MTTDRCAQPAPRREPTAAIGCVVLTQGRRPAELAAALDSLAVQRGVWLDVVVVGNGWAPDGLPEGVRAVALAEDRGIPAGRNAGVPVVGGELLFFLDDDARLAAPDALARVQTRFAAEPDLGLLQLRVLASDGGRPPRDWVPRLRVGDPGRSSDVTAVWEGAVAMRRALFERIGGWPEPFRFAHEGIDLAWRVMDAGQRVAYAGDITVLHPAYVTAPTPTPPTSGRATASTWHAGTCRCRSARSTSPASPCAHCRCCARADRCAQLRAAIATGFRATAAGAGA